LSRLNLSVGDLKASALFTVIVGRLS
jgi:hypothetical protein